MQVDLSDSSSVVSSEDEAAGEPYDDNAQQQQAMSATATAPAAATPAAVTATASQTVSLQFETTAAQGAVKDSTSCSDSTAVVNQQPTACVSSDICETSIAVTHLHNHSSHRRRHVPVVADPDVADYTAPRLPVNQQAGALAAAETDTAGQPAASRQVPSRPGTVSRQLLPMRLTVIITMLGLLMSSVCLTAVVKSPYLSAALTAAGFANALNPSNQQPHQTRNKHSSQPMGSLHVEKQASDTVQSSSAVYYNTFASQAVVAGASHFRNQLLNPSAVLKRSTGLARKTLAMFAGFLNPRSQRGLSMKSHATSPSSAGADGTTADATASDSESATAPTSWRPSSPPADAIRMVTVVPGGVESPYKGAMWDDVINHMGERLSWSDERFWMTTYTVEQLQVSGSHFAAIMDSVVQ